MERRREVEQEGKHIGQGLVHLTNECCPDSLLQLLARKGFVSQHFVGDVGARLRACRALRALLIQHSDAELRPRQRTSTGAVADVPDANHDRAFLQHDVHGEEIVAFFVRLYPGHSMGFRDFTN